MGLGAIPWSKIVEYGRTAGLDGDMIAIFVSIIRAMDAKYVEWQDKEAERKRKHNTPPSTDTTEKGQKR